METKMAMPFGEKLKVTWAVVSVLIAAFDMITDWWAFQYYVKLSDTWSLNYTYLGVCVFGSALFCFEVRNGIVAYRLYSETDRTGIWDVWEKNLQTHQEVVSFLLLIIEDIPAVFVLYFTFKEGNCALYNMLFQQTWAANLSLLGAVISAVFKVLWSVKYCCCRCCSCEGIKGCCDRMCFCCCRVLRPTLALILMAFSCYLYSMFNDGTNPRPQCDHIPLDNFTTTAGY